MNMFTLTSKNIHLYLGLVVLASATVAALVYADQESDLRQQCESDLRLKAPEVRATVNHDELRAAVWDATHPCGQPIYSSHADFFNGVPDPSECEEIERKREAEVAARKKQRRYEQSPAGLYDLLSCATAGTYEAEGIDGVDTIKNPWRHHSWVLGGDCEELALHLKTRKENPMCLDFVLDDEASAKKCRKEIHTSLKSFCARDDLELGDLRWCIEYWGKKVTVKPRRHQG